MDSKSIIQLRRQIRELIVQLPEGWHKQLMALARRLPAAEVNIWAFFGNWVPGILRDGALICECSRRSLAVFRRVLRTDLGVWPDVPPALRRGPVMEIPARWFLGPEAEAIFLHWATPENQRMLDDRCDSLMPQLRHSALVSAGSSVDVLQRLLPESWWAPNLPPRAMTPEDFTQEWLSIQRFADALGWALCGLHREPPYLLFLPGSGKSERIPPLRTALEAERIPTAYTRIDAVGEPTWESDAIHSGGSLV